MPTTHTTTNTAPTATTARETTTGRRVELAHYETSLERRVLVGQRVDGVVRVTDEPATGEGRSYLVETGLEKNGELQALVDDYLAKSRTLDYPAMHGWF